MSRLIDLTVFAPLGLVSVLCEQWPAFQKQAQQNRQAVINRVQLAQLAARVALERAQRAAAPAEEPVVPAVPASAPAVVPAATLVAPPAPTVTSIRADDLPIADYESLAAIHVVHRLATLRPGELELVREFEQANRGRRTVLAKIEQLQESSP